MLRRGPRIKLKLKQKGKLGQKITFFFLLLCMRESERREKEESQGLLSAIYGDSSVEVHRVKNESSSHRRGLHVGTENAGFFQGSKRGVQ